MYNLELRSQITSIASSFQIFECVQCAEAIKRFLSKQGIRGKQIKLFTGSTEDPFCNIYHEIQDQNISTNGRHEAIALEIEGTELVFDNIHPQGVLRLDWINNLYCPIKDIGGDFQITEIDF
ncbi:MAG: papain fold toxin domain-containing protein [Scytonema sp. PMC 1069.18]|nr:papain fold toxin domain-containing protein [Scytonema sp. PMC 1069.18]MEC4888268.1 papain fold toxin domain-containing protein [Scytonema sp. PMC 1070.18]